MAEITAVIVDDEPLARDKLTRFLADQTDVAIVGEADTGVGAIALIRRTRPQLVFLDIGLPDCSGFEVIEALEPESLPLVVFVTAYDAFALRAFEVHALDYLLKPFEAQRLGRTLERARAALSSGRRTPIEPLLSMLTEMRARQRDLEKAVGLRPDRLLVRSGTDHLMVKVAEIDWIEAADNYVQLHVGSRTHLLRETILSFEQRLDSSQFLRIHRSAIVNLERVKSLRADADWRVTLADGTILPVSRSYRAELRRRWLAT